MKKILFIAGWFEWRGWGKIASIMENYFSEKYDTVTLITFCDWWFFPIRWKKIYIWSIWKKSFPGRGYIALFFHILNTIRYIRYEKPDIVICIWSYNNFLWLLAKKFFSFKLLLTQHEHITLKIKLYALLLDKIIFRLNKYLIWDTNIVCVSKEVMEDTVNYYGIQKKQAMVIYNWFDFDSIQALWNEPIDIKDKYIINIWALSNAKNQEMLIKAFSNSNCKSKYKLLFLWEWKIKENLINTTKKLWIEDSVIFLWFDRNPYKFLKNASMFCFTSLSEALPTVLIESLILKVPVLTVPVIWSREILDNWNCWIISEDWNIDNFSKLLDKYTERDNSEIIERWYKFAEEKFQVSVMMQRYEDLIFNVL